MPEPSPNTDNQPQSIRDAIAEALGESGYAETLQDQLDILDDPGSSSAVEPATEEETPSTDDDQLKAAAEAAAKAKAEADSTAEKLPEEYFGTSLEGLSDEQREAVIAALSQRDSYIQQLQQKLVEEPPALEEKPPEPEVEITDDDILRAIGLDPEQGDQLELEYARKFTLPIAKQVMALEETVQKITETENVRDISTFWNGTLDRLEGEFGKLPGDRVQVLQYAAREKISDPEVLYFRLTVPTRKAIDTEVSKVRQDAAKRAAQGGLRPRSTEVGGKVLDTKDKDLRQIVREAALQAQEESGFKWKDVLKGGRS